MSTHLQYDEKALFVQIAAGDEAAFAHLFHAYTPRLLPFLTRLTRSEYQAREIIHETFLRLWVSRAELVQVEQPSSWIFKVAANMSLTWLRKQSNRQRIMQTLEVNTTTGSQVVTGPLETKELSLLITRAVDALPQKRQQIYRLSREQGLNHQQIAEQLNLSASTVANQISISLQFIRDFINRDGLSIITLFLLLKP